MGAYVALGASAFVPLLHGVQRYGLEYMLQYSGMKWYLLELALYGGGVGLYGVSAIASESSDLADSCSAESQNALRQAGLIFGGARTRSSMSLSYAPCTYTESPLHRLLQRVIRWIYVKSKPLIEQVEVKCTARRKED